ncbi:hypothetical protein OM076_02735 [Solirubrobacter ginsenosidimutans]|uniref:Uncharacterized protein n=1 Tax=Solirubrobacter ginsenosidimutans TaxID=490573 RepID=A0A9X3MMH1_9ACTN|nr:hypothetical protein [Solirubrobacter ginsenosidimutans]MDA0159169.1 hypothetical protein [Solirubrobacter ginsenosidimutans]
MPANWPYVEIVRAGAQVLNGSDRSTREAHNVFALVMIAAANSSAGPPWWTVAPAGVLAVIALLTFIKVAREYTLDSKRKRTEHFWDVGTRLLDDPALAEIFGVLYTGGHLSSPPAVARRACLAQLETVALLTRSRLIRPAVAYYMLGKNARDIWGADAFWTDIPRDDWPLLKAFVDEANEYWSAPPDVRKLRL